MNDSLTTDDDDEHLISSVATTEKEHEQNMKAAHPHKGQTIASTIALLIASSCLFGGFWWNIRGEVRASAIATKSPIQFEGKWIPMKRVYHPGETAYFKFTREANFGEDVLYLISIMALEDADTGVNYPGGIGVRRLEGKDRGMTAAYATRRIPTDINPGKKYHLVGLILSQTEHRTLPVGIESDYFEIANWGSEQEKDAAAKFHKPLDLPVESENGKQDH